MVEIKIRFPDKLVAKFWTWYLDLDHGAHKAFLDYLKERGFEMVWSHVDSDKWTICHAESEEELQALKDG